MKNKPIHPLHVEAQRLLKGSFEFDFNVEPEVFDIQDDPDYTFDQPIAGRIKASSAGGDTVLLTISLKTSVKADCSRCLEELRITIEVWTQQAWFVDDGRATRDRKDDDERLWFNGDVIDPTDSIREEIMMALPSLPKCSPEQNPDCATEADGKQWSFGNDQEFPIEESAPNETTKSWVDQLNQVKVQISGDDAKKDNKG